MRLRTPVVTAALLCGVAVVSAGSASATVGDASFALKPITYDPALTATKSYFVLVAQPGDVTGVKAGGEHGYQYVYLHLLNPGTIMIKPAGSLLIRNSHGRRVATRGLQLDTFLPRTSIDYPALLPRQALSPGRYTATVNLHSGDQLVRGYRK